MEIRCNLTSPQVWQLLCCLFCHLLKFPSLSVLRETFSQVIQYGDQRVTDVERPRWNEVIVLVIKKRHCRPFFHTFLSPGNFFLLFLPNSIHLWFAPLFITVSYSCYCVFNVVITHFCFLNLSNTSLTIFILWLVNSFSSSRVVTFNLNYSFWLL